MIEVKNRNFKIKSEKIMNASLAEQNDIIRIEPGRLLLDVIIIQG